MLSGMFDFLESTSFYLFFALASIPTFLVYVGIGHAMQYRGYLALVIGSSFIALSAFFDFFKDIPAGRFLYDMTANIDFGNYAVWLCSCYYHNCVRHWDTVPGCASPWT